jgi:predicted  nucleic acid-binding Zn-ribbon protein
LGYSQREAYDCWETDFVSLSDMSIENGEKLKSGDGCIFKFCPHCGTNLEKVVENKINELVELKKQQEQETKLKNEKRKEEFEKQVLLEAQTTGLARLPEGVFIVIFNPTKSSYGKNVVIAGTKDHILRSCVHFNQQRSIKEELIIQVIYKVPSPEFISSIMESNGWTAINASKTVFQKKIGAHTHVLDYAKESGTIYANTIDENDYKTYDNFSIHRLNDYLSIVKVDQINGLELETVSL